MSTNALDELGLAITNAGYTWTLEMRSAYEKGVRKREWVGLTDEEIGWIWHNSPPNSHEYARAIESKLKEKNT